MPLDAQYSFFYEVPVSKLEIYIDESFLPKLLSVFSSINITETFFFPHEDVGLDSNNKRSPLNITTYMTFHVYRSGFT